MGELVSFDGTRLAVRTWGPPDRPVVVLVHGLGLSMASWGRVPELLAAEHRVVAYDLRGHGRSGNATTRDYGLPAHARDLATVLEEVLTDGRRAVTVGNSLGGGIILAHAHQSGVEHTAGVVFAGSGGSGVTFLGFPARNLPPLARGLLRVGWLKVLRGSALVGRRIRPVESLSNRVIRRFAFEPDAPQTAVDQVREHFLGSRPKVLAQTTLASVSHNGVRLAPELTVPTLVLHGEFDPEVPLDEIHELMSALPHGELVSLPGAGHMLPLTRADEVADQVARWVRRLGPTVSKGPG